MAADELLNNEQARRGDLWRRKLQNLAFDTVLTFQTRSLPITLWSYIHLEQ
jgi:hypothetical protein